MQRPDTIFSSSNGKPRYRQLIRLPHSVSPLPWLLIIGRVVWRVAAVWLLDICDCMYVWIPGRWRTQPAWAQNLPTLYMAGIVANLAFYDNKNS